MSYSSTVLADAPLRYYRLGDTSGSAAAADSSTAAQAGTVNNTSYVQFAQRGALAGDSDTAALFNGSGSISVPTTGLPTGNAAFTLEGWFRTSTLGRIQFIASMGASASKAAAYLYVNSSNQLCGDLNSSVINSAAIFTDGRWHHAAFTWDGTTGTLYADGQQVASSNTLGPNNITQTAAGVGYQASYGGNNMYGQLDEVAIYGTALSSAHIYAHYVAALPAASGSYTSMVLADAPLRYYTLDDLPGSATAADSSTAAQTGTVSSTSNVTFWQTTAITSGTGTAAAFNGSGYISVPQTGLPTANGAFSLEGWFKTTTTGANQYIVAMGANATQQAGLLYLNTSNQLVGDLGGASITSTGTFTDGLWHHAVFTWDGTTGTLYCDNVQVAISSTLGPNNLTQSGAASIGDQQSASGNYFTGQLDEVAIYGTALSAARVSAHYTAAIRSAYDSTILAESGLLRYYPLREKNIAAPTSLADSSGNNLSATPSGSLAYGVAGELSGDANTAITFDGVSGYATLPIAACQGNDFTVEFLMKTTQAGTGSAYYNGYGLVNAEVGGVTNDWGLALTSGGKVTGGTGNPDIAVTTTTAVNDGNWHHIVMTRVMATGLVTIYVDGVSNATGTGSTVTLNAPSAIALGRVLTGSNYFSGTFDEVAIYNTALSAARVSAHYTAITGGSYASTVMSDVPSGYWRLGESGPPPILDLKGGYSGILSGTVTTGQRSLLGTDTETAMQFNGGSVALPTAGLPTGNNPWSLEIWCAPIYANAQSGYGDSLISMGSASNSQAAGISQNSNGGWNVYTWNNDIGPYGSSTLGDSYHLVATYNGSVFTLYVNGQAVGSSGSTTLNLAEAAAYIGVTPNNQLPGHAALQKAAIYNVALTSAQISNHYAAGSITVPSALSFASVETLFLPPATPSVLSGAYVEQMYMPPLTPRVLSGIYIEALTQSSPPQFEGWGVSI